jgi:hypothetical protein
MSRLSTVLSIRSTMCDRWAPKVCHERERGRGRERVTREEEISKRTVLSQFGEIEKEASKPPRETFVVSAPWRSSWQSHHLAFASRHLVSKPSSLFHCKWHLWAPRKNCFVFVLLFAKQASEARACWKLYFTGAAARRNKNLETATPMTATRTRYHHGSACIFTSSSSSQIYGSSELSMLFSSSTFKQEDSRHFHFLDLSYRLSYWQKIFGKRM